MRFSRRDLLATGLVAAAGLVYLLWALGSDLPGASNTRAAGIVILVCGFAASASAVVPTVDELLHGNKAYLAVTSLLGVVALVGGVAMLVAASGTGLSLMMAAMVVLWLSATIHHLFARSTVPAHARVARRMRGGTDHTRRRSATSENFDNHGCSAVRSAAHTPRSIYGVGDGRHEHLALGGRRVADSGVPDVVGCRRRSAGEANVAAARRSASSRSCNGPRCGGSRGTRACRTSRPARCSSTGSSTTRSTRGSARSSSWPPATTAGRGGWPARTSRSSRSTDPRRRRTNDACAGRRPALCPRRRHRTTPRGTARECRTSGRRTGRGSSSKA